MKRKIVLFAFVLMLTACGTDVREQTAKTVSEQAAENAADEVTVNESAAEELPPLPDDLEYLSDSVIAYVEAQFEAAKNKDYEAFKRASVNKAFEEMESMMDGGEKQSEGQSEFIEEMTESAYESLSECDVLKYIPTFKGKIKVTEEFETQDDFFKTKGYNFKVEDTGSCEGTFYIRTLNGKSSIEVQDIYDYGELSQSCADANAKGVVIAIEDVMYAAELDGHEIKTIPEMFIDCADGSGSQLSGMEKKLESQLHYIPSQFRGEAYAGMTVADGEERVFAQWRMSEDAPVIGQYPHAGENSDKIVWGEFMPEP